MHPNRRCKAPGKQRIIHPARNHERQAMSIGWLTVLKAVPWTEVISHAPKITEGAKKLWKSAAGKQPGAGATEPSSLNEVGSASASMAELTHRLASTEARLAELHVQVLSSIDLIKALSEQNAQLVQRMEIIRRRSLWVAGVTLLASLCAGVSLYMAMTLP